MCERTVVVIFLLFVIGCSLAQVQCDSATDKWTLYHSGDQPTSDPVALFSVDGVNSKVEVTNAALEVSGVDLLNAIQALQSQLQALQSQNLANRVQTLENQVQALETQNTQLQAENLDLESRLNETIQELEVVQNNSTVIKTGLQNTIRSARTMRTTYFNPHTNTVCGPFPVYGSTLLPVTDYIYSSHNITLERESVVSCGAIGSFHGDGSSSLIGGIALSTENNLWTNPGHPESLYGSGLGMSYTGSDRYVPFVAERDFLLTVGSYDFQLRFKANAASSNHCVAATSFACRVFEVPEPVD